MKKIIVNKSDEVAVVVEKIIETEAKEVILSIPRFSHLAESLINFHLLKREADALKKTILIESVDDRVIELSEMSGLKAVNPFFAKNKKQFSDIVAPKAKFESSKTKNSQSEKADLEEESFSSEEIRAPKESLFSRLRKLFKFLGLFKLSSLPDASKILNIGKLFIKLPWKFLIILILITAGFWVMLQELPRANISINVQTADWVYNDSIMTSKSARASSQTLTIPNQIFIQKKNLELKFPATGRKQVEKKAVGKIIVYNSYSSDSQPLVKRTRFLSPDGKLFRLVNSITVPGAKIVDGRIVPSSIETDVIADESGPEYNIGPVKLFAIPGFKGSPRYQAFYGESQEAMSGGFIGEAAYPTKDDINVAKQEVMKILEDSLKATVYSQIPEDFKILNDATDFSIINQSVNEEVDNEGRFSIFAEAKITVISFKEENLLEILTKRSEEEQGMNFEVIATELKYGLVRADFQTGKMSFLVDFEANLRHKIDIEALRNRVSGRSELDLRSIIFALPGIESAKISLWPFWVNKVPLDQGKINITID